MDAKVSGVTYGVEDLLRILQKGNKALALGSEIPWWGLLDQIEEACFLNGSAIEKARPFIEGLWKDEVAKNPFQPPTGWKYLPVEEAVESYRKIFGSSMRAHFVIN